MRGHYILDADKCNRPGACNCIGMPRCPICGYTRHDAAFLMDHRLCDGEIPHDDPKEIQAHETRRLAAGELR